MISIKKLSLQMFTQGADGAAAGAQTATEGNTEASIDGLVQNSQENSAQQERTPFKDLIQGDYKEDYEKAIKKRMKGVNTKLAEVESRNQKVQPVFEKLALKYGISDPNDIDSILAQIDKDNSYYENYAIERGITVEQARTLAEAERIIKANEIKQQNELKNQQFNELMNKIVAQGNELKSKYPSFDLESEMQNEQFKRFVFTGISVEDAFTIIHRDELMSGAMAYTYNQAQQDFANTQRANAGRPIENGISSQQAAQINDDMSKLSREQIEKIRHTAAARGEKVTPDNFRNFL